MSTAVAAKRGGRRGSTPVERSNLDSSVSATRTSLSGAGFALAPHALHALPTDVQPRLDFLLAAQALEVITDVQLWWQVLCVNYEVLAGVITCPTLNQP